MPTHDGRKLVSESHFRKPHQARVVVTLEVELDIDTMKAMPAWRRGAIGYLRALAEEYNSPEAFLAELEERHGVYVTDEKIEVYG